MLSSGFTSGVGTLGHKISASGRSHSCRSCFAFRARCRPQVSLRSFDQSASFACVGRLFGGRSGGYQSPLLSSSLKDRRRTKNMRIGGSLKSYPSCRPVLLSLSRGSAPASESSLAASPSRAPPSAALASKACPMGAAPSARWPLEVLPLGFSCCGGRLGCPLSESSSSLGRGKPTRGLGW